jgi:hypothetical protein
MIIDSHAHVVLPTAKQIGLMAEAGVERTVLFSTIVHPEKCGDMQSLEKEMSILGEILAGVRNNLESTVRSIEERRLGRLVLRPNGGMVSPGPVPVYAPGSPQAPECSTYSITEPSRDDTRHSNGVKCSTYSITSAGGPLV